MSKKREDLVGFCGLYCGACGIFQGRIKQAVDNLRKTISAYGFDKIAPELAKWEPAFQHHEKFEQVLDGYVKMFGECPACLGGGGDPNCAIRDCCKKKGYATCVDCVELDECARLRRYGSARKRLQEIKTKGFGKWVDETATKVQAGYCYLDVKA